MEKLEGRELLAELEDVKLAATAEIVAFVERVCGENSVVSSSSLLLVLVSAGVIVTRMLWKAWQTTTHVASSVCCERHRQMEPTTASARWEWVLSPDS